jgi:hypothetical protein
MSPKPKPATAPRRDNVAMTIYSDAVASAFMGLDLGPIAELQSDGKVEDRLRDDLLLLMRRAGLPIQKGGPNRFDLFVDGVWAFEMKMMYPGDHAREPRGVRQDVEKLRLAADGMARTIGMVVSWYAGTTYARVRTCRQCPDRETCVRRWTEVMQDITGAPASVYERDDLVLILADV